MADLKTMMNDEIRRLARKEIKAAVGPLLQTVAAQKKLIAELVKRVKVLEGFAPQAPAPEVTEESEAAAAALAKLRISADGIRKIREKRGLTQLQMARLLDVNQFTISNWEQGKNKPRRSQKECLAAIRKMGKREFLALAQSKIPDFKAKSKNVHAHRRVGLTPKAAAAARKAQQEAAQA